MRNFIIALFAACLLFACKDNITAPGQNDQPLVKDATKPAPAEFADPKFTDIGKQMMKEFESGDIDAWMNNYAENVRYYWSGGDSLIGKKAIADYWKDRRKNVIDVIKFNNDIWLPVKVNVPQKGPDLPGVWLMNWYEVDVKYKNAKQLKFWVHHSYHFDKDNKIDMVVQYLDRAPIEKALGK